jgi:uncharacterized protein YjiS (DUF1127 family)
MKKASEYRQHAQECRALAARMEGGEGREQLLRMAATWEELARERAALLESRPDLADDGEPPDDARKRS